MGCLTSWMKESHLESKLILLSWVMGASPSLSGHRRRINDMWKDKKFVCLCNIFRRWLPRGQRSSVSASSGNAHQEPFLFYSPFVYQLLSVRPSQCVQTAAGAAAREKRRATQLWDSAETGNKSCVRVMVISSDLHDIKMLSKWAAGLAVLSLLFRSPFLARKGCAESSGISAKHSR